MKIRVEITEKELRAMVLERFQAMMGDFPITTADISIEVKSKQNYKAEWELADFRAIVDKQS